MANKTVDQLFEPLGGGGGGRNFNIPVDGGTTLYRGTMIAQLTATAMAVPATTALSGPVKGVAMHGIDNSAGADAAERVMIVSDRAFNFTNATGADAVSEATELYAPLYATDDTTVADNSAGSTRPFAGYFFGLEPDGKIRTFVPSADTAGVIEALRDARFSGHGVKSATTANVALTGEQTIDGVLTSESRILVKNQSAPAENGIYVTAAGAWSRAVDADGLDEILPGMLVHVSEGTENLDSWFFLSTNDTIVIGTTSLTYVEIPALHDLASTANGEGAALIGIEDVATAFDATTVEGAFAELVAVTAGNGANIIGYEDAGGFTAAADVDAALDELYQHGISTRTSHLPVGTFYLATGAPLAIFAGGASAVPGTEYNNSKGLAIRWNNNGTHDQVISTWVVPDDCDVTANITLTILASKSGATVGDATTFIVTAYNQVVGALADADANYGGTTSAMTGDATAKTVQAVTLTLALADLPAIGSVITIGIDPTSATLGTDDVSIHAVLLTYTSLLRTS
jgi:hypothetical protein